MAHHSNGAHVVTSRNVVIVKILMSISSCDMSIFAKVTMSWLGKVKMECC